jgi:hypothetical protein
MAISIRWQTTPASDMVPETDTLVALHLDGTDVCDLTPLEGTPLKEPDLSFSENDDVSPLRGMAPTYSDLQGTDVEDLSPLAGMPLPHLDLRGTKVKDFSPMSQPGLCILR